MHTYLKHDVRLVDIAMSLSPHTHPMSISGALNSSMHLISSEKSPPTHSNREVDCVHLRLKCASGGHVP